MTENKGMIVVRKEKISILDIIRTIFNKTSKYIDSKGRTVYMSYPLRREFTEKQKGEIIEIEINNVNDFNVDDFAELRSLKKITLGKGVQSVSSTNKHLRVHTLVLSDEIKEISPDALIGVDKVIGKNIGIAIKDGADSIYIDEKGRLNVDVKGRLSKGQENYFEHKKIDISKVNNEAAENRTGKILEESNKLTNARSIYVYRTDANHSLRVILDDYPINGISNTQISNSNLIGILVNGSKEVNLEDLSIYPNLKKVYVGKDVKRVRGNFGQENWETIMQQGEETIQKKLNQYKICILSKDTVTINESPKVSTKGEETRVLSEIDSSDDS